MQESRPFSYQDLHSSRAVLQHSRPAEFTYILIP